jgi:hypothetical protein
MPHNQLYQQLRWTTALRIAGGDPEQSRRLSYFTAIAKSRPWVLLEGNTGAIRLERYEGPTKKCIEREANAIIGGG